MYGSSRAKVKVSPRSIFSFARLSYIASILFTRVNLRTYARKNYATVAIDPNRRYILMVFNQEKSNETQLPFHYCLVYFGNFSYRFCIPVITKTDVDVIFNVFLAKSNTWVDFPLVTALLSVNEYHLR